MKASISVIASIIASLFLLCSTVTIALPAFRPGADDALEGESGAQPQKIKIFVPDRAFLGGIWSAGIDFESATGKPGGWMEFIAGPTELNELTSRGIPFEVTDADPAGSLSRQLATSPVDALGFGMGSMGGYYTLSEVEAQLDSMRLLHPTLITEKQAVGYTVEGRTIWGSMISDNPDLTESEEPEVLYTSLIHAREPAGMMTVMYYMWWLLEQYGIDDRATYLVDNRRIWCIPVVNADGYAHNQSTNPSGGGLWRKNRRNNGNGSFGVDLNRNFGPDYMWNAPNGGSSTNTGSETYRGSNPFSEPEAQTLEVFMRLHEIRLCFNYHSHGRLLIFPYGYISGESEDSLTYREFAFDLTRMNRYASGTDLQTVNYSTRGNSDDFMYGDTTKYRTFAMTPEVGSSFWPASELILPIASENLEANIHASMVAGAMAILDRREPISPVSSPLIPGEPFTIGLRVRNKGLSATPALTISVTTDSGFLSFDDPAPVVGSIPPFGDSTVQLTGFVTPSAMSGRSFRLAVEISSADGYLRRDTIMLYTGTPTLLFSDGAEDGIGSWSAEGSWSTVAQSHTGAFSFHDSPAGPSASGSSSSLKTISPVSLQGVEAARLELWTRWAIEPKYDFGIVRVSTDGGSGWITLRSGLSNFGSGTAIQTVGSWGYDGYTPGLDWVRQEFDLSPFAGGEILIRFEMATDGSDGRDGWYLDDIAVHGFRMAVAGSALEITAALSPSPPIFFGESSGATEGIDSSFGEYPLPPAPGADTFDVRWRLPGNVGSLTDIRDTHGQTFDPVVFRLLISGGPQEFPLTVTWDRERLPEGSWRIRDSVTSGGIVAADMWLSDWIQVADTGVRVIEIIHVAHDSAYFAVDEGWNLVSLPVDPPDRSMATQFPDATAGAYRFTSEYLLSDSLSPGSGYWIRNTGSTTATTVGIPFVSAAVENSSGDWVLIGSVYCPVSIADICPDCSALPLLFGYQNGYFIPDTLYPGMAYWYHGNADLHLSCGDALIYSSKKHQIDPLRAFDKIEISDASGTTATLYLSTEAVPAGEGVSSFQMPPQPPNPLFDARFESQAIVEYFTGDSGRSEKVIAVNNPLGDLTITYRPIIRSGRSWILEPQGDRSGDYRLQLDEAVPLRVSLPGGGKILISPAENAPRGFKLYQNFPNPFNPRTTIGFDLPRASSVSVRVKNIIGQEVDVVVVDRPMTAGYHEMEYDATALASGVYFYTLTAAEAGSGRISKSTGKFLLIR